MGFHNLKQQIMEALFHTVVSMPKCSSYQFKSLKNQWKEY